CHYSGEVMTDGNTAVIVMKFDQGSSDGVALGGASAAIVVSAERNFAFESDRKSTIYLNGTNDQRSAVLDLILRRDSNVVGKVVSVQNANIQFIENDQSSSVAVGSLFSAETSRRECLACSMKGVLWFDPLISDVHASVRTVERQRLNEPKLDQRWMRTDEAAAFVGEF